MALPPRLAQLSFQLLLEFFRLAAQHLLLPFFLCGLLAVALLLGKVLLAPRQLVEFLQCLIDFLLFLFGATGQRFLRLVLILSVSS